MDEALTIAESEHATRKDIYGSDISHGLIYKNGRYAEAKGAIDDALHLKTRDAKLYYHAGMIAAALGDKPRSIHILMSAKINPLFDVLQAEVAKKKLVELRNK